MAKKYFPKALSVGLSLALCASLVAPSFAAATFDELHNALNSGTSVYKDGYSPESEGTDEDRYKIKVEETETDGRVVTLYDRVERTENEKSIVIHQNSDGSENKVTLDLNGFDIDGTNGNGAIISVGAQNEKNVDLTVRDNTAHIETDEDGNETYVAGAITGGHGNGGGLGNTGNGMVVWGSATLESGKISGNKANDNGGGVIVAGTFIMNGGEISNNTSNGGGGGGGVDANGPDAQFTMAGGVIKDNTNRTGASGVNIRGSSFTMTGGTILGNVTVADNGGASKVTITDGTFSNLDDKYLPEGHSLDSNGVLTHTYENGFCIACSKEEPASPVTPDTGDNTETPAETTTPDPVITDEPEVEIEDVAVPLAAGPVTGGEFIDYLWRHEDEPEADLVVEHEYAEAISWALSIGIIDAETFEADELVTVAAVRDILANFAAYADMDVNVYALVTLTGDEDEAVLNCDEVLAEFFGE